MNGSIVEAALDRLSRVFHREADFQQALGWQLHRQYPSLTIRAEYPVGDVTTDLWLADEDERMAVELKYPKKRFEGDHGSERFEFGTDPADLACYDYLADLERLETLVEDGVCDRGVAVVLTNNALLWDNRPTGANYDEFKLYDGRTIGGQRAWPEGASVSRGRSQPLELTDDYTLDWRPYSYRYPERTSGNTSFKYCLTTVH